MTEQAKPIPIRITEWVDPIPGQQLGSWGGVAEASAEVEKAFFSGSAAEVDVIFERQGQWYRGRGIIARGQVGGYAYIKGTGEPQPLGGGRR